MCLDIFVRNCVWRSLRILVDYVYSVFDFDFVFCFDFVFGVVYISL